MALSLINSTKMMRSLVSTPGFSTNIISERVHCDPLSLMASRSRCHTADDLKEMKDVEDSVPVIGHGILAGKYLAKYCNSLI